MTFKILSLDGGGMRGVISARILQEVEKQVKKQKGQSLNEYFDLIAGTSTGSILAAGLAVGKTTRELIDLYINEGQRIFPLKRKHRYHKFPAFIQPILEAFSASKYSHDGLIDVLIEKLGYKRIKDIDSPIILILAYDTLYRNTTFFTNCHPDLGYRWYDECYLWQICVASASAPTFFPPYKLEPVNKEKFGDWVFPHIDGGVSANNPALAALSLAMRISQCSDLLVSPETKRKYKLENLQMEDISILSIGTGQTGEPYQFEQIHQWKPLEWAQHITDVFMEPTSEIDSTICRQLMGGYESKRYLRLQFDLNERFKAKPGETAKDTRILLKPHERTNQYTGRKVSEEIDDASPDVIQNLIEATAAFIEQGHAYSTRNDLGPKVKQAIASFIAIN
ncbi:patatin-like phospholipase family protein [Calothrix sp. FACHB-1219]|uniref:patatin-like phospholipase family protein n=1 Tax=unclassified Calothrix TaxID=2619626 RepID=UPI001682A8B5|nr:MULTISPECIES: patatin-like phospholipase family protein [unclassified Calothrix]MBD2202445.1 patatin-like phospholipase family protein [Calothrix sp. FACHB-168]MBD2217964.1 patatin-like phospholipase family protein [Calothrix sp. FACHB-1219]